MRGRRSGYPLAPAQARGAAGPETSARRRKRQGRSRERRSVCFGLPAGAVRGGTAQGAARAEETGVRGRRSGCRLEPAQARRAAGPERAARRRKRQGRSRERRSVCFGLPVGVASGRTAARQEDSGAERPGTRVGRSTGTATSNRLRRRAAGRLTARTLACWGAARVEEDGMRGRRSGCRLKPAQARGAAGPERAARRRKRQGRSCERRRSACFGLPAGAARGGTMARQEDSGAERLLGA